MLGAYKYIFLRKFVNMISRFTWIAFFLIVLFLKYKRSNISLTLVTFLLFILILNSQRPRFEGGLLRRMVNMRVFLKYDSTEKFIFILNIICWGSFSLLLHQHWWIALV